MVLKVRDFKGDCHVLGTFFDFLMFVRETETEPETERETERQAQRDMDRETE